MNFNRWIVVVIASLMIVSCQIRIIVPEGGSVMSSSGAYNCAAGGTCTIDVVDLFFDETFTAVPASGYEFTSWQKRDKGFFGGDTNPSVRLFTSTFPDFPALLPFLETDEVFFLQPVFTKTEDGIEACSSFAANTNWCVSGVFPNPSCPVTREQSFKLAPGMSYNEVAGLLGCHGSVSSWSSQTAVFQWGADNNAVLIVGFIDWGDFGRGVELSSLTFVGP